MSAPCDRCGSDAGWSIDWRATADRRHPLGDCEHPKVKSCNACSHNVPIRCQATREDRCEGCGRRHNRRLKQVIRSGFVGDRPPGFFLGTLTGPGVDDLPWDRELCTHPASVACSGKRLGCQADRYLAPLWNSYSGQAWSWFMKRLRDELPGVDVQFWGCWEPQARQVLHRHAIVRAAGVSEARFATAWAAAARSVYELPGIVWRWGPQLNVRAIAGHVVPELMELLEDEQDGQQSERTADELETMHERVVAETQCSDVDGPVSNTEPQSPITSPGGDTGGLALSDDEARAMRYCAKYVTKGGERVAVIDRRTGELTRCRGYRPWSASRRWGMSMGAVRAAQVAWAQQAEQAGGERSQLACVAAAAGAGGALDPHSEIYVSDVAAVALCVSLLGAVAV